MKNKQFTYFSIVGAHIALAVIVFILPFYYIRSKMESIEGKLYFIKDEFIEKYNPKYHLMENNYFLEPKTVNPPLFLDLW